MPVIGMERFRPNLVVDGCEAFAEDEWPRMRVGALELRLPKPCARCAIPDVHPEDGSVLPRSRTYTHSRTGMDVQLVISGFVTHIP